MSSAGTSASDGRNAAFIDALTDELEALRNSDHYRELRSIEGEQGPRMTVNGKRVLMFASANYLNLASDARVLEAADAAQRSYGCAAGGSRLISGNTRLHSGLEEELAEFLGLEAALVFSSGYLANVGVITAFAGPADVIVSDALNHASIVDGCRLSGAEIRTFAHNDPSDLKRVAAGCAGFRRRILVVEGIYSMDGDIARLTELVPIAREHDMVVVLDDAHGIGILGESGGGVAETQGVAVDALIGNLGKAFGAFGAFVACSHTIRDYLVNCARTFIFTCGLAPGSVGAARAALKIIRQEPERRQRVLTGAVILREGLRAGGYDTARSETHIVPAVVGANVETMRLCELALKRGVYAQGIRYPAVPQGTARIRFTPTAGHTADDLSTAVAVFSALRSDS